MSRYNRCKECYNMDCIFVTGEREDIDTSECADFRSMTNADRIRSMSDEELASLFGVWVADCDNNDVPCKEYCSYYKSCGDAWLAWLKDEVSE